MLTFILRSYLTYISFVQPVIYGAQLCRSPTPDPLQVTNVTLTLVLSWLLEIADAAFLTSFIAMRSLYLVARIILCLYFAHPRFSGAVQIYSRCFAGPVETYAPLLDALVMRHIEAIGALGGVRYISYMSLLLLKGAAEVVDIARRLMEASTTTSVAAAELPRSLTPKKTEGERSVLQGSRPMEKLFGPSSETSPTLSRTVSPPPKKDAVSPLVQVMDFLLEPAQVAHRPHVHHPYPPPSLFETDELQDGIESQYDEEVYYSAGIASVEPRHLREPGTSPLPRRRINLESPMH